jgi:molybdopterin converting factor subunit 1
MRITVKFFASVREVIGTRAQQIEVAEGGTVGALWQSYVEKYPRLANLGLAYAVNHEYSGLERVLNDGDEVAFIPPVSGG